MERWRRLQADSHQELERTGIPRPVLRRLLGRRGSGVGASILDAGCGQGELTAYLSLLGYRVTGFTESPEAAVAARRVAGRAEVIYGTSAALPAFQHKFHLVIVRELASYSCSLFDSAPLRTTAMLMSAVKPGGRLVFLDPELSQGRNDQVGHRVPCFARHLECFPGTIDAPVTSEKSPARGWRSWFSGTARSGPNIVEWQAPAEQYTREEWLQFAEGSRIGKRSVCCAWAENVAGPVIRRVAA